MMERWPALNHQACGVLNLASAAGCPDRALLSKHSNQNEEPDLGQESSAYDLVIEEHVLSPREGSSMSRILRSPGSKSFRLENVRFQMQTTRDASGIQGGLRRSPLTVRSRVPTISQSLPIYLTGRFHVSAACLELQQVKFGMKWPPTDAAYRRPIRATAISAISCGSPGPDPPTSITLRATISQSGSFRSTTPNKLRVAVEGLVQKLDFCSACFIADGRTSRLLSSVMIAASCARPSRPVSAMRPNSARWARSALISCVR